MATVPQYFWLDTGQNGGNEVLLSTHHEHETRQRLSDELRLIMQQFCAIDDFSEIEDDRNAMHFFNLLMHLIFLKGRYLSQEEQIIHWIKSTKLDLLDEKTLFTNNPFLAKGQKIGIDDLLKRMKNYVYFWGIKRLSKNLSILIMSLSIALLALVRSDFDTIESIYPIVKKIFEISKHPSIRQWKKFYNLVVRIVLAMTNQDEILGVEVSTKPVVKYYNTDDLEQDIGLSALLSVKQLGTFSSEKKARFFIDPKQQLPSKITPILHWEHHEPGSVNALLSGLDFVIANYAIDISLSWICLLHEKVSQGVSNINQRMGLLMPGKFRVGSVGFSLIYHMNCTPDGHQQVISEIAHFNNTCGKKLYSLVSSFGMVDSTILVSRLSSGYIYPSNFKVSILRSRSCH